MRTIRDLQERLRALGYNPGVVDGSLAVATVNAAFLLAGMVIGSYLFGAAWDDRNVMKATGLDAYDADDEEPAP